MACAALRRPGPADRTQPLRPGGRLCAGALDGGCRPGTAPRPSASGPHRRAVHRLGAALSTGRLLAPVGSKPLLSRTLSLRPTAGSHSAALRVTRRLVLFVRAPRLG